MQEPAQCLHTLGNKIALDVFPKEDKPHLQDAGKLVILESHYRPDPNYPELAFNPSEINSLPGPVSVLTFL